MDVAALAYTATTSLGDAVDSYATTISGYVLTGFSVLMTALLAWTARTLVKVQTEVTVIQREVLPTNAPPLADRVDGLVTDVALLRAVGSDRLREILEEQRRLREDPPRTLDP